MMRIVDVDVSSPVVDFTVKTGKFPMSEMATEADVEWIARHMLEHDEEIDWGMKTRLEARAVLIGSFEGGEFEVIAERVPAIVDGVMSEVEMVYRED
jgi:hypothetical protein